MFIFIPNVVNVSHPAAALLRLVEKFKLTASAVVNYYLVGLMLDHP